MEKVLSENTFLFWDLRQGGLKPVISPEGTESDQEKSAEGSAAPQLREASSGTAAQAHEAQAAQAQSRPASPASAPASSAIKPAPMTAASPMPAPAAMQVTPEQERLTGVNHDEKAQAPSPMPPSQAVAPTPQAPTVEPPQPLSSEPDGFDTQRGGIAHGAPLPHEAAFMQPQAAVPPVFGDPSAPSYPGWHLRKKRADVFVDLHSSAPFLKPLCDYLKSKGLSVLGYDPKLHYLPYDVVLADKARLGTEGRCAALDGSKAAVWAFLKRSFAGRL